MQQRLPPFLLLPLGLIANDEELKPFRFAATLREERNHGRTLTAMQILRTPVTTESQYM
ncbi:hypothetical protein PQX77_018119, partial [Marasmius sp. AFHP31]